MTKRRIIALLGALTLLVSSGAFPAQADPPEPELGIHLFVINDPDNDLVGFWNTTRDGWCDWVDGGEIGPPPVEELVPHTESVRRSRAVVLSWHTTRPLEIWQVDDPDIRVDECADTVGQTGPWATGEANLTVNLTIPAQAATNSGTASGQGTVFIEDGSRWHYSWTETGELVDFEIVNKQAHYNLSKKGK